MSTIINGSSPSITFSDSTTQASAGLVAGGTIATGTITTLTTTTLNAPSGVLATQNGMTGIAKAWVNFNGSTGAVNSSFNVSSCTRNSTGNYTVNYTTAMPSATYVWTCFGCDGSNFGIANASGSVTNTTTSSLYNFRTTGNSQQDAGIMAIAIFSS
jgi:hypothetical protein